MLGTATNFVNSQDQNQTNHFLHAIIKHYSAVVQARPNLVESSSPWDFDRLYEQLREEERLSELFDAHIEAITRIIESDEIESVTALQALRQLVEVLTANRKGSFVAMKQTLLVARYIQNVVVIGLKKLPVLGTLVEAAEKTLSDMEDGFDTLERDLEAKSNAALNNSLPRIKRAPLMIEQQVLALPSPAEE